MGNGQSLDCDSLQKLYNAEAIKPDCDPALLKRFTDQMAAQNCSSSAPVQTSSTPPPPQNTSPVSSSGLPVSTSSSQSNTAPAASTGVPVTIISGVSTGNDPPPQVNVSVYTTCADLMKAIMTFSDAKDYGNAERCQDEYQRRLCGGVPPAAPVVQPPVVVNEHGTAGVLDPGTGASSGAANPTYTPPPTIYPGPSRPPVRPTPPQVYSSPNALLYAAIIGGGGLLFLGLYQSMRT